MIILNWQPVEMISTDKGGEIKGPGKFKGRHLTAGIAVWGHCYTPHRSPAKPIVHRKPSTGSLVISSFPFAPALRSKDL